MNKDQSRFPSIKMSCSNNFLQNKKLVKKVLAKHKTGKERMMMNKKDQYRSAILLWWLVFQLPILTLSWQNLATLDLSWNELEGPLPTSICNSNKLIILVLANNKFSGQLPSCLGNFSDSLIAADLRNNSFEGNIPDHFSKNINLKNLALNGNNLEGPLPRSLKNCAALEVLDVGNNKLTDAFPTWLSVLPQLHVLILRSNRFYGTLSPNSTSIRNSLFPKLRILDASHNNFTGTIPYGFLKNSFPAMVSVMDEERGLNYISDREGSSYYLDSISLIMKGTETVLHRVLLVYSTIDLSLNKFEGMVPESVGNLTALKQLNLSHNSFNGLIPPALGKLRKELESLDLSSNQFTGQIPVQLVDLTYLGKFNLSYNHLSGPIPPFKSQFGDDSFYGNDGLCGTPLDDCTRRKSTPDGNANSNANDDDDDDDDDLDLESGFTWKSVLMGYGFGTIVGLFLGNLGLYIEKPKWIVNIIADAQRHIKRRRKRRYVSIGN